MVTGQTDASLVFVIDDDEAVRESTGRLIRSVGLQAMTFANPNAFLSQDLPDVPSCLVLDVRLPGMSGLEFQAKLAEVKNDIPIIFITGHADIPMTVKAMKAGAAEFLAKPFREQDLLDAIQAALRSDRDNRAVRNAMVNLRSRFDTLTPRERQVMTLVVSGMLNKQVAAEIGIAEITVKMHRGHVYRKMGARSLAELISIANRLGIHRP